MGTVYFYDSHTHATLAANSSPDSLAYPLYLADLATEKLGVGLHGPFNSLTALDAFAKSMGQTAQPPIPGAADVGTSATSAAGDAAKAVIPDFGLVLKNVAPWFIRGIKVMFGGVLIILGISRLTGASNQVTQIASKIPVVPV